MTENQNNQKNNGEEDFLPGQYANRISDLEAFKAEFEGVNFYRKVQEALKESNPLREQIKGLSWESIKNKITLIILGGLGLIFVDLLLRAIPSILNFISP